MEDQLLQTVGWNSTFNMLSTALKFKTAFASYKERESHYNYAPSLEEWNQVEKVCKLLEVFNLATHVISGTITIFFWYFIRSLCYP